MKILLPLISFVVSFFATFLLMPWLLRLCQRRGLYDMPNERKVHHNKIPRLGGVLFLPCSLMGLSVALTVQYLLEYNLPELTYSTVLIMSGIFLIYLIGLLDDILGLAARLKFLVQLVAALFLPVCNLYINDLYGFLGIHELSMWLGWPLTVFLVLLIVNSVNLIDGIDGLASGLCIIALTAYTLYFFSLGALTYAVFSTGLLGSVLVFFYFNMFGKVEKMTKTFMGDTGSLILGYGLSYLCIKMSMANNAVLPYREESLVLGATMLLIPTFDLVRVAIARLRNGVSIFHADKTHIHHRFLAAGCSMRQSLAAILALQVAFCVLNAGLYCAGANITLIFAADILCFAGVQWLLGRKIARRTQEEPHTGQ